MANEKRLIDANVLKIAFKCREMADIDMYGGVHIAECFQGYEANEIVDKMPTVDAVEVVHGRWEQVQTWATKAKYRCSVCGREIMSARTVNIEKYPYCHCGAKMDGDGNG